MEEHAKDQSESHRGSVARAAGTIALGNVLSRVLGLVRDVTITHFFFAGLRSAFDLAWQIPQWIFDLLVGGHISAALVPIFSESTSEKRRDELWHVASVFFGLVTVVLAIVVLAMELLAPWLITLMGGGLSPELQQVATLLLRLTAPALLFLGLTGAVTGLLYALRRFTYPAFATATFNAGIVFAILVAHRHLNIASAAGGILLGSILQLGLQLPGLRDTRLRPTWNLRHPALRRIMRLYLPVLFGVAVGIVGQGIDRRLASGTGDGSIAWMRNATTLIQTALGLIAVAVSTAVLPALSRASEKEDQGAFQDTLGLGLRLILTLVIPAMVGLYALGRPIVTLFFEHGAFSPQETGIVTWALYLYLIGLPFAAVDQLLIFAFYARQDTLRPNLVGAYAIGIYLLFALPFVGQWGMFALVIANSAQWTWHTLLMLLLLRRHVGWPRGQRIAATLLRTGVASGVMGLAAWGTAQALSQMLGTTDLWARAITLVAALVVALGVYLGLAVLLRLEEIWVAWRALRRRLGAGKGTRA